MRTLKLHLKMKNFTNINSSNNKAIMMNTSMGYQVDTQYPISIIMIDQ